MAEIQEKGSPREIAEALFQRAVALWGEGRATALRSTLDQAAEHLWKLSRNTPEREVEPGFFL